MSLNTYKQDLHDSNKKITKADIVSVLGSLFWIILFSLAICFYSIGTYFPRSGFIEISQQYMRITIFIIIMVGPGVTMYLKLKKLNEKVLFDWLGIVDRDNNNLINFPTLSTYIGEMALVGLLIVAINNVLSITDNIVTKIDGIKGLSNLWEYILALLTFLLSLSLMMMVAGIFALSVSKMLLSGKGKKYALSAIGTFVLGFSVIGANFV